MKEHKIKNIFNKVLLITLAILITYVVYCSIFNIYQTSSDLRPTIIIIGSIVMIMFLLSIKKIISRFSKKQINIAAIILCVIFFIGMSVFGNLLTSIPSSDLSNIIRECNIMIEQGGTIVSEGYFARYTNQIPLVIMVYIIYKIGTILSISVENLNNFATVINSLLIAITAYFTYLSVKKVKDEHWGIVTLIFFIINPIFYLYSSYFYSDTLCMPFAAIAIYTYICSNDSVSQKKKIYLLILTGIILALGITLRVVLIILLIAMIMHIILRKEKVMTKIKNSLSILGGILIGILIYTGISAQFGDIKNKDIEFPVTNWIMYSLNEKYDGKWNSEDFNLTFSQKTYEEKKEKNIEVIKQRLNELGISGWINLSENKIAVNWSNGDYDYNSKLKNVENINKLYEYFVGNKNIFVLYFLQICKVVLMITLLVACIGEINNNEENINKFLLISILGAFAFYLLWEVLSRYSLTFLPWIMLLFPAGMQVFEKILNIKDVEINFIHNKPKKINMEKAKRIFFNGIVVCSILIGVINFDKYALKKQVYYDKVVMQEKSNEKGISKIGDNIITETFITNKKFNCIAIKFKKQDTSSITHYNIDILDSNGKILRNVNFNSEDVKDNAFKTIFFDNIKPNGEEEYTIKIYSEDATEENSIGIATYYGYGNYDIYQKGTLKVNEQEIEQDITFKVQKQVERTYLSKKIYILLFIIVIIIEIVSFYPYIRTNNRKLIGND